VPQPEWAELERRITRLEKLLGAEETPAPSQAPAPAVAAAQPEFPPITVNPAALLPLLGRGLLGLAGAYLLRALTESAAIPAAWGVAGGILYALFWLFWAAQTPTANRVETAIHSLTAVLVLCPLVWEGTMRFHAISTWAAAALLTGFAIFGLAVSWRKNLLVVATMVTVAVLATAAGLFIGTRDVVPFTVVFLAVAAAVEVSSCLEHWLSERWLTALAADLAVLLATWLVTGERGLPEAYAPIPHGWLLAMQVALLVVYLASTIVRTLLRGLTFTTFEMAQCAAAFLIGVGGGLRVSGAAHIIAAFALVCGAACYVVAFAVLERATTKGRNFYTYSTFGILLVLAGSGLLMAGVAACLIWSALALACIWAGTHFGRLTLRVHGGIYLLLALAGGGALQQAAAFTLGKAHWKLENQATLWPGLLIAALCYVLVVRDPSPGDSTNTQIFRLAVASAFGWMLLGAAADALVGGYHAAFHASSSYAYCETMRTSVFAGAGLLMAWAGARWNRAELSRLIYPAMILGAYRLAMVDFSQGTKPALFLSLLVYGGALMALPKLARTRQASA
jgi:hypothetical protein